MHHKLVNLESTTVSHVLQAPALRRPARRSSTMSHSSEHSWFSRGFSPALFYPEGVLRCFIPRVFSLIPTRSALAVSDPDPFGASDG